MCEAVDYRDAYICDLHISDILHTMEFLDLYFSVGAKHIREFVIHVYVHCTQLKTRRPIVVVMIYGVYVNM